MCEFVKEFFTKFVHEFMCEIRTNSYEFLARKLVMLRMACTVYYKKTGAGLATINVEFHVNYDSLQPLDWLMDNLNVFYRLCMEASGWGVHMRGESGKPPSVLQV